MQTAKNVTLPAKSVTEQRDTLARARPPYGGSVTVSRVTEHSVTNSGERDSTACRPTRHEAGPSIAKKPMSWFHVAALNLIEDHAAGIPVTPAKLEAARRLLAA